ncbi:MAG TPA: cation diffusion facilitator family transporter, partial [Gemmatimonadaceae bacterium]
MTSPSSHHSHAEHAHAGHEHGTGEQTSRLRIALLITVAVLLAELVGGFVANSLTLLADAGHLLTDVGALGFALFVAWFVQRPETPKRTFGYVRLEILAAFLNGGTLLVISVLIVWEAISRLRHPEPVNGALMLAVAVLGLVANVAAARTLHPASASSLNV